MKEKKLQEVLEWYKSQGKNPDIKDFVDIVINKTSDVIFDEIKTEFKSEFASGTLKHPFIISSDYYLDLKLKEIKEKCVKTPDDDLSDDK